MRSAKPAGDRIDSAEPILSTPEQGARARAGQRITLGGRRESLTLDAARRVIGFLLTVEEAEIIFHRESKSVIVTRVKGPENWKAGHAVIDYNECQAIKELLELVENSGTGPDLIAIADVTAAGPPPEGAAP